MPRLSSGILYRACLTTPIGVLPPLELTLKIRTRTQTVLFTDMVNYTLSVSNADRSGLRNLLELHEQRVSPILRGRGGRIVKNIGDSFMALFESATDAVRAGLDLVEANPPREGGVSFRVAAATGDVEETSVNGQNDAFGDPCNLAARILNRTPGGEVWLATSTFHCMNQAEIPWEPVGRFALKNIPGESEAFRAVAAHQCFLPEPISSAARAQNLVRWVAGEPAPLLAPGSVLLLEGFRPGSTYLQQSLELLPVIDPSRIWLCSYNIGPQDRHDWLRSGRGLLISVPAALQESLKILSRATRRPGADTLILDIAPPACELLVAGLALPTPNAPGALAEVVAGYSYQLSHEGRWVNNAERAMLRVDVDASGASITVLSPGISLNGRQSPIGSTSPLTDGLQIRCGDLLQYRSLNREGYLGALYGESAMKVGLHNGQSLEVGREPNHPGLLLPARTSQDNIRWSSGNRAARAREKGFTLDNVLTGRRHALLRADAGRVSVQSIHDNCPTLLWSGTSLYRLNAPMPPMPVQPGDLLLIGSTALLVKEGQE